MEWREGRLKVEGRGEEREEEERVRIKGNGHYLHRSRLTILHRPSRSRPSPAAIPDLGRVAVRSFVRSFELVRAKTHGNSSVHGGEARISDSACVNTGGFYPFLLEKMITH